MPTTERLAPPKKRKGYHPKKPFRWPNSATNEMEVEAYTIENPLDPDRVDRAHYEGIDPFLNPKNVKLYH